MTTPQEKAAELAAKAQRQNPSVAPGKDVETRKRIPLSVPQRKLEVPEIPGFHLRWFRGTPQRLAQAERAGFIFVSPEEIELNSVALGGDASHNGNTDLGSRVSVIEGSEVDGGGNAIRMYLMKQSLEHYKEDKALNDQRNDSIAETLTAGYRTGQLGGRVAGESAEDAQQRYVDPRRTRLPDLFRKKAQA